MRDDLLIDITNKGDGNTGDRTVPSYAGTQTPAVQPHAGLSRVMENRIEALSPRPISPAAERQRRRRERRRRGAMVIQIVISPAAMSNLVRLGWLSDKDLADREAVRDAFVGFARWALAHA